jgi:hypothetical protein
MTATARRNNDTLNAAELLHSFRRGVLLQQLDQSISDVIDAIANTGCDGSVTMKLAFKLNKAGQIECAPKIEAKVPKMPLGTGIYYADESGQLTRRDPRQMDIDDVIGMRPDSAN